MNLGWKRYKWWWIASIAVLALLLVPLLIPLNMFRPRVEAAASEALQQPVSIGRIGFTILPWPTVNASDIAVGKNGELKVGKVSVTPAWSSALSATKVINNISVDQVAIQSGAFGLFSAVMKKASGKDAPTVAVRDGEIEIHDVTVEMGKDKLGPLHMVAKYTDEGTLRAIGVATNDARLRVALTAQPGKEGFRVEGSAPDGWTVPLGMPFKFLDLKIDGHLDSGSFTLNSITGHAYDGSFDGNLAVRWGAQMRLEGAMTLDKLELTNLVPLLSPNTKAGGKLSTRQKFSSTFDNGESLSQNLRTEGDFNVQDGVYYGLDLAKAATLFLKTGDKGGETKFNTLSGHLLREGKTTHLTNLNISSGILAATGNVDISPREELGGVVTVKVSNSALGFATGIPLQLSGTLASPMAFPTKSALAGAAIGTGLLPGVGTAAGANIGNKAGEFVDKLFGGKKK